MTVQQRERIFVREDGSEVLVSLFTEGDFVVSMHVAEREAHGDSWEPPLQPLQEAQR